MKPAARVPAFVLEADHKGEQVEAQRQDPQQRDHDNVLTNLVGRRQKYDGSASGKAEPEQVSTLRWSKRFAFFHGWRACVQRRFDCFACAAMQSAVAGSDYKNKKRREPDSRVQLQGQARFEQRRKREERQEGSQIRECVQTIRRAASAHAAEPGLQQRAGGGGREVRQARAYAEQSDNLPHRISGAARLPVGAGRQRRTPHPRAEREDDKGKAEQNGVKNSLRSRGEPAGVEDVRVDVSAEEEHLEKEHAGRPHGGRASEPRENVFPEQRLYPEEEEGAQENRQAKRDVAVIRPLLHGLTIICAAPNRERYSCTRRATR